MSDLPPMLARPSRTERDRWRTLTTYEKRRLTLDAKTAYRKEILRLVARLVEEGPIVPGASLPHHAAYGLTFDQAKGVRLQIAQVLRTRADNRGGLLSR